MLFQSPHTRSGPTSVTKCCSLIHVRREWSPSCSSGYAAQLLWKLRSFYVIRRRIHCRVPPKAMTMLCKCIYLAQEQCKSLMSVLTHGASCSCRLTPSQFNGQRKAPFTNISVSDVSCQIRASLSEAARKQFEKRYDRRLPHRTVGAIFEIGGCYLVEFFPVALVWLWCELS